MVPPKSSGPLPYLNFCTVEIANAARTVEYLRRGLANNAQGHWILSGDCMCGVLYRLDGGDCVTPHVFVSPAADPAPWYDSAPDEPGAGTFLGVVMLDIKGFDSTITRVVTPRIQGLGGGTFSGQRRNAREWSFRAALVSADDAGADFGLRWLTSVLETSACATCSTCQLTVRMVCPPEDCSDENLGEWTSYDVALTEGPLEVETYSPRPASLADSMIGWRDLVIVEWKMVAGNPFLYKAAVECLPAEIVGEDTVCTDICDFLFGAPGTPHCCTITSPKRGVLAPIYTFESVSGMNGLLLGSFATCPVGADPGTPITELALTGIPANTTVVVDCSQRTIRVTDSNGDVTDGQHLIDLSDGRLLGWPQAAYCDGVTCFCARGAHPCSQGGDTTVAIATQAREG